MRQRLTRARTGRIGLVLAVLALSLVLSTSAAAAPPELTEPPERLYYEINSGPHGFTGTDLISGDDRELILTGLIDGDCDPLADGGDEDEDPDYFLGGCSRVQMNVAHGELVVPMDTTLGFPLPDGIHSGGAIIESSQNGDGTGLSVNLNGTQDQLNAALADLTYEPDTDYSWNGSNPEGLDLVILHGDPAESDSLTYEVEIRILDPNEGPTLTVPSGPFNVAVDSETPIPDPAPDSTPDGPDPDSAAEYQGEFYVEDPDVEDFGLDDRMLLVMVATCGEFELRGALTIENDIEQLLLDIGVPQEGVDIIMPLLPDVVTTATFGTGNTLNPHQAIAAIADYDEINYALSQVTYHAEATAGSCDLWTIITDIGHNGLPFQYVGSPIGGRDQPQPGVEIPAFGLDFDTTSFVIDGGAEISVPANLTVPEGDAVDIPIAIDTSDHPAFDVNLTATGIDATGGGVDYDEPPTPATYPLNDPGPLNVAFQSVEDGDDEGDEQLTVQIDLGQPPPGVSVGNDTVTITIEDDDDGPPPTETSTTTTTTVDPTTTTTSTTIEDTTTTTSTTIDPTTTTTSTTIDPTTTTTSTTIDPTTTTTSTTIDPTTTTTSTTTVDPTTTTTSTTTVDSTTTTTEGGGTTTTTEGGGTTTTTDDDGTTTTDGDPGGTTTSSALGGGNLTTTTTDPGGVLGTGQGQGQLPATGDDSLSLLWIGTLLTVSGFALATLSNRRTADDG
jgi:hypothetical protein